MKTSILTTMGLALVFSLSIHSDSIAANACNASGGFFGGDCSVSCDTGNKAWCHAGGFFSGADCGCDPPDPDPGETRSGGSVGPGLLDDGKDFADYADTYGSTNMTNLAVECQTVISIVELNGSDADFQAAEDNWLIAYGNLTATEKADCETWAAARGY